MASKKRELTCKKLGVTRTGWNDQAFELALKAKQREVKQVSSLPVALKYALFLSLANCLLTG